MSSVYEPDKRAFRPINSASTPAKEGWQYIHYHAYKTHVGALAKLYSLEQRKPQAVYEVIYTDSYPFENGYFVVAKNGKK